jgi:hypothetical protein
MNALRQGHRYKSLYHLLLEQGKSHKIGETCFSRFARGTPRECFYNSLTLSIEHNLIYCEGYALSKFIPTMHAWCLDPVTEEVIDTTWTTGYSYLGVRFDKVYAVAATLKRGYYGLLDNMEQEYPLLRIDPSEWLYLSK